MHEMAYLSRTLSKYYGMVNNAEIVFNSPPPLLLAPEAMPLPEGDFIPRDYIQ